MPFSALRESSTTDAGGNYRITDVPVDERSVEASADGFKPQTKIVTVNKDEETTGVNFALKIQKVKTKAPGHAAVNRVIKVKNRHEQKILAARGVVGIGVGLSEKGQPVIKVYLKEDSAEARGQIRAAVEDIPVHVLVTGLFEAF